jgi:hypothetical protein
MSGFPASISITESDAGGSGIYTIGVTDTDTFACFGGTGPFSVQKVGHRLQQILMIKYELEATVDSSE